MKKETTQSKQSNKDQQLHIHIERWQDFVDILDDGKKVLMLSVVVVIIGLTLFSGITFIILQLKKSFTYSDITTNALGVTTLRDEQKEVSYFLFNTATLWANSGIEVKEGDVISVHSSGSAHTAIHHLHNAGEKNYRPDEDYFDADGGRFNNISERDKARRKYRLVPDLPNNALIMQVYNGNFKPPYRAKTDEQKKNFYYVAKHRENILIHESGTLYFAINDIVLDSETIKKMMRDNFNFIDTANTNITNEERQFINRKKNLLKKQKDQKKLSEKEYELTYKDYITYKALRKKALYEFGPYYDEKEKCIDTLTLKTEMDYYLEHNYTTAWFDDNVGSFLIVVEKQYRK